ncbi:MAG: pyridoxal phosphate-dependent aminotransferase [Clostridiales bacterium]|nr:pyridoxal phosphate-dependent aminotransferase [Clostridiales bacterium]
MSYDFDRIIDRRGTSSLKWEVGENELPMWVADMDFETAPAVREALRKTVDHGIFGYATLPEEWYSSIMGWWEERHGLTIEKDWLIFSTGVIPSISTCVRRLTSPGENVLVQTPVYNMFFNSIVNNGRNVLENPLVYNKETTSYRIDWEDLEKKLANPQTSMMILCNPHNPIGKIWDRETLARIGELCAAHHVTVISDEIHCDLTEPGCDYIPFASVSETCRKNSITCIAPTKAFNIAGLHSSAVIVPEKFLRHKVWRALNTDEVAEPNAIAAAASIAAFTEGGDWLDALCAYISGSRKLVGEFIAREIPRIRLIPSEATYLLWIDYTDIEKDGIDIAAFIRKKTGLFLSKGSAYGANGEGFLRMNIACPRSVVEDGLKRLKAGVEAYTTVI